MIDFYYSPTPNGWKVAIMLAETGLEHRTVLMNLRAGDQLTPAFRAISPNAKMPAIVDHDAPDGPQTVFESGAILLYLAERTGQFGPQTPTERIAFNEWLFWQAANQGPMGGQLSHFVNYSPKGETYSHNRYKGEFERALAVMETWLDGQDYMLGRYSIVDMMCFPWAFIAKPLGVSLDNFPNVAAWRQRIKTRPAVIDAINLHKDAQFSGKATAEQNATLFNQSAAHLMQGQEKTN
ncbi:MULTISPECIES: glutathione S-transferase family protein [unclassified Ruegeria]|uniref:glutathione S-transferase family protein n=1 Tax=unclassified Ruegeria TaxID=2625375 RepID=UPI001488FB68|nr:MULTISPECIES: glutathione S-transferase N-terminal domain-containing protein [unclassified Ruegeria]